MQTPIALHNLTHGKWRSVVSTSGVAVAIILVFMQLGFLNAVAATATLIYDHLEFDVMLRSPDYFHFCDPREFPRTYLYQAASLPEVKSVKPLHATLATWRIPTNASTTQAKKDGQLRGILALGIDPSANVFDLPEIEDQTSVLSNPNNLLIDLKTTGKEYGAVNGKSFCADDFEQEVEIWDKRFQIVGCYELGAGLAANGSVIMSTAGYGRFFPSDTAKYVNFGLIELEPGVDARSFSERLKKRLSQETPPTDGEGTSPTPVSVLTRDDVQQYEQKRWLVGTPIGAIFLIGVGVALVVGAVVVYMVLASDVANHIHEYATLKAMGYKDRYLSGVVMQQAVAMAVLGYIVSLACAEVLYRVVGYYANLPMDMTWTIRILVFGLSVGMCCVSGLATIRKLRAADPADLF